MRLHNRITWLLPLLLLPIALLTSAAQPAPEGRCSVTLNAGTDIATAAHEASAGATICLQSGTFSAFALDGQTPARLTIRGLGPERTRIVAGDADGVALSGVRALALTGLTIAGGKPAGLYAATSPDLRLTEIRVTGAALAVHIDDNSTARLEDVTISGATDVGLLLRRGASLSGVRVSVLESGGTGVAAVAGAGPLALREGEVVNALGPGIFVGVPGCGELGAGTLDVPSCFLDDPQRFIADQEVSLEGVSVRDGPGTGIVIFPGVRATITRVYVAGQRLTGLFVWGAEATVSRSEFDGNWEHAIEYRSYPDPRGTVVRAASGRVTDSMVRSTQPLGGAILGGGVLAQGGELVVRGTQVAGNFGIGISYVNRATGEATRNRITNNLGSALCVAPGAAVYHADNTIAGNRSDEPGVCLGGGMRDEE